MMTHRPFACLINTFVNGRGEVCHNLDTSRSKVALRIREDRERRRARQAFLKETKEMRQQVVNLRRWMEEDRKEGLRLTGDARTAKFEAAADMDKRAKALQKEIESIAKKYNIR